MPPVKDKTPKKKRKVALVGSASSSRLQAPWGEPDFEIWYLAWRTDGPQKADRYFDMHDLNRQSLNVPAEYHQHLAELDRPVYTILEHPDVPKSITYPIEDIVRMLGGIDPMNSDGRYFASSIAYMLALAILEEFEEIHLYGIDLLTDGEYAYQRPNAEYLIGLARGLGRRVHVPTASALLKFNHIYGYEKPPKDGSITVTVLDERIKQYTAKHARHLSEAYASDGARQEAQSLKEMLVHVRRGGSIVMPKEHEAALKAQEAKKIKD